MADENRDFDLSELEQKIMLVILRQHPTAYGVSIQEMLLEVTSKNFAFGSIYAALERLEEKGFVKSTAGEPTPQRGGRRKVYFTLTAVGSMALHEAMNTWDVLRRGVSWKGVPA